MTEMAKLRAGTVCFEATCSSVRAPWDSRTASEMARKLEQLAQQRCTILAFAAGAGQIHLLLQVRCGKSQLEQRLRALRLLPIAIRPAPCAVRASRRIHLLSTRSGEVLWPHAAAWSSYRAYLGLQSRPAYLEPGAVLTTFGATRRRQRERYQAFVEQALLDRTSND